MEGSDDAEVFGWTSDLGKDLEAAIPTDQIESLCEVYEGNKEWLPLLPTFLLKLFEGEDRVYSGSVGTETALRLREDLLCKYLEPLQYYTCKDFPNDTEEGWARSLLQSLLSPMFLYSVKTLASLMSCGTSPSL